MIWILGYLILSITVTYVFGCMVQWGERWAPIDQQTRGART